MMINDCVMYCIYGYMCITYIHCLLNDHKSSFIKYNQCYYNFEATIYKLNVNFY